MQGQSLQYLLDGDYKTVRHQQPGDILGHLPMIANDSKRHKQKHITDLYVASTTIRRILDHAGYCLEN